MNIAKSKNYVAAMAVAALVLGGAALYVANPVPSADNIAHAYTSPSNPLDPATAPDSTVVTIPDTNLRTALNAAIAAATGTTRTPTQAITVGEMRSVTTIPNTANLVGKNLTNLEGLQYMTNLTGLNLSNNPGIQNISPLSDLKKVLSLNLNGNNVSNVTALSDMTVLRELQINNNKNLTNADIVTIGNLRLETLYANGIRTATNMLDLMPLANLSPTIRSLDVSTNLLTRIQFVYTMTNLRTLFVNDNQLGVVTSVNNLVNLVDFRAQNNEITDIGPLALKPTLRKLVLNANPITDYTPILSLPALRELDIVGMKLTPPEKVNLQQIAVMTYLTSLNISNNRLNEADIAIIRNKPNLQYLHTAGNEIVTSISKPSCPPK